MNFIEACKAMQEGKKVRRLDWFQNPNLYVYSTKLGCLRVIDSSNGYDMPFSFTDCDMNGTDWEIYHEPHKHECKTCGKVLE